MIKNPHAGSTLESFLKEEGTYEEAKDMAIEAVSKYKESKHTPGDWRVDDPEPCYEETDQELKVLKISTNKIETVEQVEISVLDEYGHNTICTVTLEGLHSIHDAHLIAAAPKMLKALKTLNEDIWEKDDPGFYLSEYHPEALELLKEAIELAEPSENEQA